MDKKEKLQMLRKLSEADLTKNFLIPLFESDGMGCKSVRYTHTTLEFGKDIVYYKNDEYGNRVYTGIQVKKTKITAKNISDILRQTTEAFGEPFTDLSDGKKKDLNKFVVLTSNEFSEAANRSFRASLRGVNLDRLVTCIDGNQLVGLLEKNMPSAFWDEYEYFDKYFRAMRQDFEDISDVSVIGQKEPISLERIYVSLKVTEEVLPREMADEEDYESIAFEENLLDSEEQGDAISALDFEKVITADRAAEDFDRLVIVGVPGSGKTTLLKYLALKTCRENLESQKRACVPVPITLRQLIDSGNELRAYIDQVFDKYEFPKAKDFVEKDLKEGRCRLLLDGFDELATKESQGNIAGQIQRFARKYPKAQVVVTSRVAGYHDELKGFSKFELVEFDDRQIEKFVENWFGSSEPEKANLMFEAIKQNERIKTLARNPLMIAIIAIIYEEDRELPQRRADLYKRCVEVLLNKWDVQKRIKNKYASDKKEIVLRKLAYYAHSNNKRVMKQEELTNEMLKHFPRIRLKENDAKPFLEEIWQRSYLLRQISMDSYDFLHLSFQEYFTALELKESHDGLSTIIQHLDEPWWEEPILLYAGISKDASALIKTIGEKVPEDMFCSNLLLSGKCVADAEFTDVLLRRQVSNGLWSLYRSSEFWVVSKRAIDILSLFKPDEVVERLISYLRDQKGRPINFRRISATALGLIGSEKAVEQLIDTMAMDEDVSVRGRAASALGMIGCEKAVEPLLKAITKDQDSEVRGRVVSALGRIASDRSIDFLLGVLATDSSIEVRHRAACALARIGDEKAVEDLTQALANDTNYIVRKCAAYALGIIGSKKATDSLIGALTTDEDDSVRGRASCALGLICDEKASIKLREILSKNDNCQARAWAVCALASIEGVIAMEPLMQALANDKDAYVRGWAASALGTLASDMVIEPLIHAMMTDNDSEVRARAASALARVGGFQAAEALLDAMATDVDSEVKRRVACALGSIGDEKAIEPLVVTLTTAKDGDLRGGAATALGRIGSKKAIEPLVGTLINDKDSEVRWRSAIALGSIVSEKAIEPLVGVLTTDKDGNMRGGAATALGSIGSEKSIETLVGALTTDKDSSVRGRAAEALGSIGSEKSIEPLKQALGDEGEYFEGKVKDAAFTALEKISRRNSIRITRS